MLVDDKVFLPIRSFSDVVGLELIVLDGNCAVGCGSGTDCIGW
jgi:hypothetical protein